MCARFNHCLELYDSAIHLLCDALDSLKVQIFGKAMDQLAVALGTMNPSSCRHERRRTSKGAAPAKGAWECSGGVREDEEEISYN